MEMKIPHHVAIIMDGNGRWAKARGYARTKGHQEGMNRVIDIVRYASDRGVEVLSLYAFSTENWKRPAAEVGFLMDLLVIYLTHELKKLHENNVRLHILGDVFALPEKQQAAIRNALDLTKYNTGMQLNIALNYGGRDEILRAIHKLADKETDMRTLSEEELMNALDTGKDGNVDLLIRPGGEKRLSNFLLLQNAYAEIVFSDVLWPDFREEEFELALIEYNKRDRRYGGVK